MVQRSGCNREIELAHGQTRVERPSILLAESPRDLIREREDSNPGSKTVGGLLPPASDPAHGGRP